jgi:hypothetical protein
LVLAGCGRIAIDPRADATVDTIGTGPFGPSMEISELNILPVADDPTLTPDQLEIYFAAQTPGSTESDIYRATRARATDPWSVPEPVVELNSLLSDGTPELTTDGLTLYFATKRASASDDIWVATRTALGAPWSQPVVVAELNSAASDVAPAALAGQLELFMSRRLNNNNEIYRSSRGSPADVWGQPAEITELVSPSFDSDPHASGDGLTIYWCSLRSGNSEIWRATRLAPGMPFMQLEVVPELASSLEEDDPWISPDGHAIYFSRGSDLASDAKLYVAYR